MTSLHLTPAMHPRAFESHRQLQPEDCNSPVIRNWKIRSRLLEIYHYTSLFSSWTQKDRLITITAQFCKLFLKCLYYDDFLVF